MNDIILTIKIYRTYLGVKMLKSLVDQFEVSDFGLLKDMPPRHLAICFVNNKAVSVKMKNPYYTENHPFHSKISTLRIYRSRESEDRILYQAICIVDHLAMQFIYNKGVDSICDLERFKLERYNENLDEYEYDRNKVL